MKKIIFNPIFLSGLILKLCLIIIFEPVVSTQWYVPFLKITTSSFNYQPWQLWIAKGGSILAFPYGYVMWLLFCPFFILFSYLNISLMLAYEISLLVVDFLLLLILTLILPNKNKLLLLSYWLSPIVILASYVYGYNDLVPILFIVFSFLLIKRNQFLFSGCVLALAISAKLSMIIAFPFFLIYFYNNKSIRNYIYKFLISFLIIFLILSIPILISNSSILMILNNPEMGKVLKLIIVIGDKFIIYVIPTIYLLLIYFIWRVKRINFELFLSVSGIIFLIIVLLAPSSPGWFVWSIPFLSLYQSNSNKNELIFGSIFSFFYVLNTLLNYPLQFWSGTNYDLNKHLLFASDLGIFIVSLTFTFLLAAGFVLVIRIFRNSIIKNDYFRLSRKPFAIGIAGDSASGKDTFVNILINLFGKHSVAHISGDNYHLWDRQKPMWQVMTHLNPLANDLERFSKDIICLLDGKKILTKFYKHNTGKMSKTYYKKSNDFIIASGLHSLYLPILRENYNLKIFLDIEESLRIFLKNNRDLIERGQTKKEINNFIEMRKKDGKNFIRPQLQFADLVFLLETAEENFVYSNIKKIPKLKLTVKTRRQFNELSLHKVLVGVCGLHVEVISNQDGFGTQMIIEGDANSEDIELSAKLLFPRIFQFLDIDPKWKSGTKGLMQLITISHIDQILNKRFN